jgi:hypothetical protein
MSVRFVLVTVLAAGLLGPTALRADSDLERCPLADRDALVGSLVAAFNAGNDVAVDRIVAQEPAFEWFSATGRTPDSRRLGAEAYDRSTLRAYVRQRHRHRERWTNVDVGWRSSGPLMLTREADDHRRSRTEAKMDTLCAGGRPRIIVWSM